MLPLHLLVSTFARYNTITLQIAGKYKMGAEDSYGFLGASRCSVAHSTHLIYIYIRNVDLRSCHYRAAYPREYLAESYVLEGRRRDSLFTASVRFRSSASVSSVEYLM